MQVFRVILNQRKTCPLRPDLYGLYAYLGLLKVSKTDRSLARLHPRLRAYQEGDELRFYVRFPDAVVENALKSSLRLLGLLRSRVPAADIRFFRFEDFPNVTDNPTEIFYRYEASRAKGLL